MKPTGRITRPSLKYYGSGFTRANWIVGFFPEHDVYVEPCFGSGAVILNKPVSKVEIANDLDGRAMNFHRQLRDNTDALLALLRLTPWHEGEYRQSLETVEDPLEDARRFFVACWQSIPGGPRPKPGDFRLQIKPHGRYKLNVQDMTDLDHLSEIAARLRNVQFAQRDALKMIERVRNTGQRTLIYFDPPYLAEHTKRRLPTYPHELDHEDAARLLRRHDGPVVVSGYRSELYERLYEAWGWTRHARRARVNGGGAAVECIWVNDG